MYALMPLHACVCVCAFTYICVCVASITMGSESHHYLNSVSVGRPGSWPTLSTPHPSLFLSLHCSHPSPLLSSLCPLHTTLTPHSPTFLPLSRVLSFSPVPIALFPHPNPLTSAITLSLVSFFLLPLPSVTPTVPLKSPPGLLYASGHSLVPLWRERESERDGKPQLFVPHVGVCGGMFGGFSGVQGGL